MPGITDMRIAIVGSGISGLTCALALARQGCKDIQIYEMASNLGFVGAGIQLAPNMARVLERLGVWKDIEAEAVEIKMTSIREGSTDKELGNVPLTYVGEQYGFPHMVAHRASLVDSIYEGCKREAAIKFHFATVIQEVMAWGPKPKFRALARDGRSWDVEVDLLLGCDGVKSSIRSGILKELGVNADIEDTGQAAYRIMLTRDEMKHDPELLELIDTNGVTRWIGEKRHIIAYPVSKKSIYNISTTQPDTRFAAAPSITYTTKGSKKEMQDVFSDFCPKVLRMLDLIPEGEVCEWRLRVHSPLPTWVHGQVALLGDACHPTLPHLAQGAAQAIEDAAVLGTVLSLLPDSSPESVNKGLKVYELLRKERAQTIVDLAAASGRSLHLGEGKAKEDRDKMFAALRDKNGTAPVPDKWADAEVQKMVYGHDCMQYAKDEFGKLFDSLNYINLFLNGLFFWSLLKPEQPTRTIKSLATQTLVASGVSLATSTGKMTVVTALNGHQLGWLCLWLCGMVVVVNSLTIFWIAQNDHPFQPYSAYDGRARSGSAATFRRREGGGGGEVWLTLKPKRNVRSGHNHLHTSCQDINASNFVRAAIRFILLATICLNRLYKNTQVLKQQNRSGEVFWLSGIQDAESLIRAFSTGVFIQFYVSSRPLNLTSTKSLALAEGGSGLETKDAISSAAEADEDDNLPLGRMLEKRLQEKEQAAHLIHSEKASSTGPGKSSQNTLKTPSTYASNITIIPNYRIQEQTFELTLYDTNGEESEEVLKGVLPRIQAVLLCFALDDVKSLEDAREKWAKKVTEIKANLPVLLIGCKRDLKDSVLNKYNANSESLRVVHKMEGIAIAQKVKANFYIECTSKDSDGSLDDVFLSACKITTPQLLHALETREAEKKKLRRGVLNVVTTALLFASAHWLYDGIASGALSPYLGVLFLCHFFSLYRILQGYLKLRTFL
ncbi:hypothetical protein D9758_006419 [Tetrapyrgos nigripes]|uniref:FAD-binding domain-containing protein n=1 Tax=Tetrapyrgos nigripes TaxID=182062 RepID=A0A8H5D967_9AGAR|nr:hypothetical protein D9758_006419 [Tetrapyrgos nigripes]